jgi:hypothetical protein
VNIIGPVQNTNTIRYADFFRLGMADGTYYFATTPAPITIPSISATPFTALGQLVSVGRVQRDIKSTANETTVTLVGVDTTMLGLVLNSKIKGSSIDLWHGFFDSNNQLITEVPTSWVNNSSTQIGWTNSSFALVNWTASSGTGVYKYFSGYVNSFSISEQWTEEAREYVGVVTISASSFQLILQNRTAGRYTNDNAWQAAMPIGTPPNTDTSMNRVTYISTINYQFGKPA